MMFTSQKLPRCSEGSLHPQSGWIQSGLQGRGVVVYEIYKKKSGFASSCSKK